MILKKKSCEKHFLKNNFSKILNPQVKHSHITIEKANTSDLNEYLWRVNTSGLHHLTGLASVLSIINPSLGSIDLLKRKKKIELKKMIFWKKKKDEKKDIKISNFNGFRSFFKKQVTAS